MLFAPILAPSLPPPPSLAARLPQTLARLADDGVKLVQALGDRFFTLLNATPRTASVDDGKADIRKALPRITRGILWATELAHILAGHLPIPTLRPRPPKAAPPAANTQPPTNAQPAPAQPPADPKLDPKLGPKPAPSPEAQAKAAQRWMRRYFATRPIGHIVQHIADDLGVDDDNDDLWPWDLIDIPHTIAEWTAVTPPQPAQSTPTHHPESTQPIAASKSDEQAPTQPKPPAHQKTP